MCMGGGGELFNGEKRVIEVREMGERLRKGSTVWIFLLI